MARLSRNWKPIFLRDEDGGAINWRIASKTTLNWASYLLSNSLSLRSRFALVASICLSRTNALIISIFTETARLLCRIPESNATPYSVNARGSFRVPPQFDVPKWNFKQVLLIGIQLQLHGFYSGTHRPCFFISSYIASGARSISPGHMTAPYSTYAWANRAGSRS
jgi:hypothetical protein